MYVGSKWTLPEFDASMPTKQWLQVEVGDEIVMLLSLISNLDFKPLFVPIEANSGSVYSKSTFAKHVK